MLGPDEKNKIKLEQHKTTIADITQKIDSQEKHLQSKTEEYDSNNKKLEETKKLLAVNATEKANMKSELEEINEALGGLKKSGSKHEDDIKTIEDIEGLNEDIKANEVKKETVNKESFELFIKDEFKKGSSRLNQESIDKIAANKTTVLGEILTKMDNYETASKLNEVSQKRIIRKDISIVTQAISVGTSVMALTGVGTVVAKAIDASMLAGKMGTAAAKAGQHGYRNTNVDKYKKDADGGYVDKSDKEKDRVYIRMINNIFTKLKNSKTAEDVSQVKRQIQGTGIDFSTLKLKAEAGKSDDIAKMMFDALHGR